MKFLLYIILLLLLTSCGQRFHVKRMKHHMDKALQKGAHLGTDTTFIERNIKIEGVRVEFTPKPITLNDTIYFTKEKVVTKILLKHDSLFVETNCPDTVFHFKERTITKTVTAVKSTWLKWWYLLIALAVGLVVGALKR
jgi:hypothetical protein